MAAVFAGRLHVICSNILRLADFGRGVPVGKPLIASVTRLDLSSERGSLQTSPVWMVALSLFTFESRVSLCQSFVVWYVAPWVVSQDDLKFFTPSFCWEELTYFTPFCVVILPRILLRVSIQRFTHSSANLEVSTTDRTFRKLRRSFSPLENYPTVIFSVFPKTIRL